MRILGEGLIDMLLRRFETKVYDNNELEGQIDQIIDRLKSSTSELMHEVDKFNIEPVETENATERSS